MPRGELLKKLFYSYAHGDGDAFQNVASEIIRDEESKNNRVLANALRRNLASAQRSGLMSNGNAERGSSRKLAVVPFEREKQLPLVDVVQPERRASDLILIEIISVFFCRCSMSSGREIRWERMAFAAGRGCSFVGLRDAARPVRGGLRK